MKPKKVLFLVSSLEIGGVQSGIMNFVRITPQEQIHFDIIVHTRKAGYYEEEFKKYGEVYHMPLLYLKNKYLNIICMLLNNVFFYFKLKSFLITHEPYDAIHAKLLEYAAPAMEAARRCHVPVRIAQSHVDKPLKLNPFHRWYYRWCAGRIEKNATVKLAVSEKAIELLFAPYNAKIIKNPTINLARLDPTQYEYAPHSEIRLIQIGTYSRRKNQCFSVCILKSLLNFGQDATLSFVGYPLDEPEYIQTVEGKIHEYQLQNKVFFYPKDAKIPFLLSQSDYMLIPSLREGLPNVALEAQAMGVPCFLSDNITKETDCGLCQFLSLEKGPEDWAREIIRYRKKNGYEKQYVDMSSWDQSRIVEEYVRIWQGK